MKYCPRCKKDLPLTEFNKNRSRKDGLHSWCKACNSESFKKYKATLEKVAPAELKTCTACNLSKPNSEFHKSARNKDGLAHWCKSCCSERRKASYRKDPDRELTRNRAWLAQNVERTRETRKRWRKENPAKLALEQERRRAALRGAQGGTLDEEEWTQILEVFDYRCAYCLNPCKPSIDHFRPISLGGQHTAENSVPACISCNSRKQNRLIFDWVPRLSKFTG